MIYLGTKKYSLNYGVFTHEFYYNNTFYSVHINSLGTEYRKLTGNKPEYIEQFAYILPETLEYISYKGFEERYKLLNNILEIKIFEKL